ncbi:DNA polymerase III subunit gamma/tau [candidate division WOR-3 bacterium]|nr:DNA polymerase III subunit gamma/tau [candidate division WOR-3 bacterium]
MAHRVISLRYRPQNFDELTGQNHIVLSLKGAIKSGRIGHALLFAGPRGVGKTTTARIFAKSLNCVEGPTVYPCQKCQLCREITLSRSIDVIEIDGASNRGIEEIRSLREGVKYSPLHGRYKIYIIDEVHMLTQEAFNALLKTLEEPPPKVVFVFATTNPTKVPTTILSRCQRFVFKRLSVSEITSRLRTIADKEKIKITENALHYLAIRADGSIRDGESILEQLASFIEGEVTEEDVFKLIGFLGNDFYFTLLNKILTVDLGKVIMMLNKGIEDGADPVEIYRGFTNYLRAAFLIRTGVPCEFVELNSEEIEVLKKIELSRDEIIHLLEICLRFEDIVKRSVNVRIAIELLFSQLILCLTKSKKRENNNRVVLSSSPNKNVNIKEALFLDLQKNSPKLAGIIHKADITKNNDNVTVSVKNEFAKTQLVNNQKKVKSILKKILNTDFILNIEIVHQKEEESDLIQTIKVLFDGEEVR